jgi:hypothetical protein
MTLISVVLLTAGVAILAAGEGGQVMRNIAVALGSALLGVGSLSLLWELGGKRSFTEEILERVGLSAEVSQAGLLRITDSLREIDCGSLLRETTQLDVVFVSNTTWMRTWREELRASASRPGSRMRFVVPDPDNDNVMAEIAQRFERIERQQLVNRVREVVEAVSELSQLPGTVELYLLPAVPVYSYYRIGDRTIIRLYENQRERMRVPVFVCGRGGWLSGFGEEDFAGLLTFATRRI